MSRHNLYKIEKRIAQESPCKDLEWHKGKKTRQRRHLSLLPPQGPTSH